MASTISHKQVAARKLLWVGPLTLIVAALVNSFIRTLAVAFLGVPESFTSLQLPSVIGSTVFFVLLALLAFVLVSRFAQRPTQFYRVLALIALCLSLLTPIMALTGIFLTPGMNLPIFWTMLTMHIITAAVVVGLLTTLTRK